MHSRFDRGLHSENVCAEEGVIEEASARTGRIDLKEESMALNR